MYWRASAASHRTGSVAEINAVPAIRDGSKDSIRQREAPRRASHMWQPFERSHRTSVTRIVRASRGEGV